MYASIKNTCQEKYSLLRLDRSHWLGALEFKLTRLLASETKRFLQRCMSEKNMTLHYLYYGRPGVFKKSHLSYAQRLFVKC